MANDTMIECKEILTNVLINKKMEGDGDNVSTCGSRAVGCSPVMARLAFKVCPGTASSVSTTSIVAPVLPSVFHDFKVNDPEGSSGFLV